MPVFTLETLPPQQGSSEQAERVRLLSRKGYGRDRAGVEAERMTSIQERYYPVTLPAEKVGAKAPSESTLYPGNVSEGETGREGEPGEAAGEQAEAPHHVGGTAAESTLDEEELPRRSRARRQRLKKSPE